MTDFVGSSTGQSSASVTTQDVTLPTNVVAGDIILIFAAVSLNVTFTTPTGYTVVAGPHVRGTSHTMVAYSKVAAGGEASTAVTITSSAAARISVVCRLYRDSAGVFDATATETDATNSTSIVCPSITTVTNASVIVVAGAQRTPTGSTTNNWTDPSGFGNRVQAITTDATHANMALVSYGRRQTTLGATGTATIGSDYNLNYVAFTLAIRPGSPSQVDRVANDIVSVDDVVGYSDNPGTTVSDSEGDVVGFGNDDLQAWTQIHTQTDSVGIDDTVTATVVSQTLGTLELQLNGVWTNITAYLLESSGITITRGREREFDTVQPGTFTATLYNGDGRFTPVNATLADGSTPNPYYPYIRTGTPLRFAMQAGGASAMQFVGTLDELPARWEGGRYATVTITATDAFKDLSRRKLFAAWQEQLREDGATRIYPLSDVEGELAADLLNNGPDGVIVASKLRGVVSFQQPGPFTTGETCMLFEPYSTNIGISGAAIRFHDPLVEDAPFTIEMWFRSLSFGRIYGALYHQTAPAGVWGETFHLRHGQYDTVSLREGTVPGTVALHVSNGGLLTARAQSSNDFADGEWHHVAAGIANDGRTPFLYIDGDPQPVLVRALTALQPFSESSQRVEAAGDSTAQEFFNGYLSGPIVTPLALTAAQIRDHYDGGLLGFAGERSDQRIARLARWGDITLMRLEPGYSTVGAQDTNGKTVLEALQLVETSEQGFLFIAGDGYLTFHNRHHAPGVSGFVITGANVNTDFVVSEDEQLIVNDITVNGVNAGPIHRQNLESQEAYGIHEDTKDTLLTSNEELAGFAGYRMSQYATPTARTPTLNVDVLTQASLQRAAVLAELGTPLDVSDLPDQVTSDFSLAIESMRKTVSESAWTVEVTTGPVILADFATYGVSEYDDGSVYAW